MRKFYLDFILISYFVMLSAAAGGSFTQPKPLTGSEPELPGSRTGR
jgi:hypothetical protein